MVPAKLTIAAAALALGLATIAIGAARRDTGQQPDAGSIIASPAEAREVETTGSIVAPVAQSSAPTGEPAKGPTRTVRVVLDSPFGTPPDVVITTEPAKPPVFDDAPPVGRMGRAPLAPSETAQDKPRRKKKAANPRHPPGMLAGQGLPPPFFAVLPR